MKKFLMLLSILCFGAYADTINLHWLNEDGSTYQNSTCVIDSDLILPATPPTKYGYTFTGWELLPYVPIEYLESTGTQYIDTGYVPNQDTRVICQYLKAPKTYRTIFGARQAFGAASYAYFYNDTGSINSDYGTERISVISESYAVNKRIIVDKNKNIITIKNVDGSIITTATQTLSNFSPNSNLTLWGMNTNGTFGAACIAKIYSVQIYDNETLVRDFIPVLDKDGVPCLFDKVEGKFYYNQGTGQFIAGPVLTE